VAQWGGASEEDEKEGRRGFRRDRAQDANDGLDRRGRHGAIHGGLFAANAGAGRETAVHPVDVAVNTCLNTQLSGAAEFREILMNAILKLMD
jgi:hypothetical protein